MKAIIEDLIKKANDVENIEKISEEHLRLLLVDILDALVDLYTKMSTIPKLIIKELDKKAKKEIQNYFS